MNKDLANVDDKNCMLTRKISERQLCYAQLKLLTPCETEPSNYISKEIQNKIHNKIINTRVIQNYFRIEKPNAMIYSTNFI